MENLTHDNVVEIKRTLDDRYRQIIECDMIVRKLEKSLADHDKRIELLILNQAQNNKQQKINNWLTTAIAAGIITLVIKVFLGG